MTVLKLLASLAVGVASQNWYDAGNTIPKCGLGNLLDISMPVYSDTSAIRAAFAVGGNDRIVIPTANYAISGQNLPDMIPALHEHTRQCGISFFVQHYTTSSGGCANVLSNAGCAGQEGLENAGECMCQKATPEGSSSESEGEVMEGEVMEGEGGDECLVTTPQDKDGFYRLPTCGSFAKLLDLAGIQSILEDYCLRDANCSGYSTAAELDTSIAVLWFLDPTIPYAEGFDARCTASCSAMPAPKCCADDAILLEEGIVTFQTYMKTTAAYNEDNWPSVAPSATTAAPTDTPTGTTAAPSSQQYEQYEDNWPTAPTAIPTAATPTGAKSSALVSVTVVITFSFAEELTVTEVDAFQTTMCAEVKKEMKVADGAVFTCTLVLEQPKRRLLAGASYNLNVKTVAKAESGDAVTSFATDTTKWPDALKATVGGKTPTVVVEVDIADPDTTVGDDTEFSNSEIVAPACAFVVLNLFAVF
jgi:hypothetical protein